MNAIRSNNVSLKYQRFKSSGCKDIGFTKTEFVAKTQFLWQQIFEKVAYFRHFLFLQFAKFYEKFL